MIFFPELASSRVHLKSCLLLRVGLSWRALLVFFIADLETVYGFYQILKLGSYEIKGYNKDLMSNRPPAFNQSTHFAVVSWCKYVRSMNIFTKNLWRNQTTFELSSEKSASLLKISAWVIFTGMEWIQWFTGSYAQFSLFSQKFADHNVIDTLPIFLCRAESDHRQQNDLFRYASNLYK